MYYEDLGRKCGIDDGPHVRAVGGLSPRSKRPFPTGPVPPAFLQSLRAHLEEPWQPVVMCREHFCEFCENKSRQSVYGHRNIWIPTGDVVYVVPELIFHYIEAHGYKPPDEFIAAVLACPAQRSANYTKLFPKGWLAHLKKPLHGE